VVLADVKLTEFEQLGLVLWLWPLCYCPCWFWLHAFLFTITHTVALSYPLVQVRFSEPRREAEAANDCWL